MSFRPTFTLKTSLLNSFKATPPFSVIYADEPCACWFSPGRTRQQAGQDGPVIVAQVALEIGRYHQVPGWYGRPRKFDYAFAEVFYIHDGLANAVFLHPVYSGILWHGTSDAHCRFDCCQFEDETFNYDQLPGMSSSSRFDLVDSTYQGRELTVDLYRPFGAGTATLVAIPAYIYPGTIGPAGANFAFNFPDYDNILIVDDTIDVRDGNTRIAGNDTVTYGDGDELRIPTGITVSRYVVVRVERFMGPRRKVLKRVFVLRHSAVWPGP